LTSGENPLAAKLAGQTARSSDSTASAMTADDDATMTMQPAGARRADGMRGAVFTRPVQLEGLAQVVGLAIGAPEFQRR
jgi:hypothetical protein